MGPARRGRNETCHDVLKATCSSLVGCCKANRTPPDARPGPAATTQCHALKAHGGGRLGKPDEDDIALLLDAELEAARLTDPDAVLFRSCRVCLLRLPSADPVNDDGGDPPPAADPEPPRRSAGAPALSQAAPAASQGGRGAAGPGPACGGNQAGSAGVAGDGLGAAGGAARALGCSQAFAEEVNAETVAARARMGGFVASRLEAEVRVVGLAAVLRPVRRAAACACDGRCFVTRSRAAAVACDAPSCALPELAGSSAPASAADAGLRWRGQVVWRGGVVTKEVDARTTHLVVLPPPDAGAPALPPRHACAQLMACGLLGPPGVARCLAGGGWEALRCALITLRLRLLCFFDSYCGRRPPAGQEIRKQRAC